VAKKGYTVFMKNAEASVRMEGCKVTPHMRKQCARVSVFYASVYVYSYIWTEA